MNDQGIFGFDVSYYQADARKGKYIDFQKMRDCGASFVVIKCGQYNWRDPSFDINWEAAKAVGLVRMSYWFEDYRSTGKAQAQRYWQYLNGDIGEKLWIDFETGSGSWHEIYNMIYELQVLSNLPDEAIGIYTNYYYWLEHGPKLAAQRAWFVRHPLWLANYGPIERVKIPPLWKEFVFWQSATAPIGQAAGVQSREIDYDRFNGTQEEFTRMLRSANL